MPGAEKKHRIPLGEEKCDLAACKSMMDVLNKAMASADIGGAGAKAKKGEASQAPASNPQGAEVSVEADATKAAPIPSGGEALAAWRRQQCPLTREALGDATWGLLHSTAAYYPDRPSDDQQASARGLVEGVAALYPCSHCREDFQEAIKEDPPKLESREAFSVWVCNQHNIVNEKLGKPLFKCDLASLDLRWRTGHKACWEEPGQGSGKGDDA